MSLKSSVGQLKGSKDGLRNNFLSMNNPISSWTPKRLSNLTLWLRADLGVSTSGSSVIQWNDQSGNGYNFTQSAGSTAPTVTASWQNSKPALAFNGTQYMSLASVFGFVAGSNFTIATVQQFTNITTVIPVIFDIDGVLGLAINNNSTSKRTVAKYGSGLDEDGVGNLNPESWVLTAKIYDNVQVTPSTFYVNGSVQSTISPNGVILTPSGTTWLGARSSALQFMYGNIAEVVVSNYQWSAMDISNWTSYVHKRYGI